ncbi:MULTISPECIES: hypothetical protein [Mycobacteriaceae]|uniref:hypothetical protein n=1 Tax=Mycobacteriaceae TaxID=1762 RepID=UPI000802110A|nr:MULTISPECIES: hypothetical protein [Mycobacteriaceae]MCK0175753.1 hypothetical protein [Mycolicibacterium sp. F2034L]OBB60162.1 hypothetical protein A5757_10870 [Mycobacterium sp. 852013-51886_SCH5428379]
MSASPTPSRPRVVDIAFWLLVGGAVLLLLGGLLSATVTFETLRSQFRADVTNESVESFLLIQRGMGIGSVLAGGALAFVAGRARQGDARFRRATIALALAVAVVLVILAAGGGIANTIALLSLVPIAAGTVLLTRRGASEWFDRKDPA